MLSLIELQNKKVEAKRKKYEKDEMDAYLELVFDNYKQLTEENAKLTEQLRNKERQMQAERDDLTSKIKTLSDGVQYYRSIETTLQKALILAEKTSKETKDAAILKAESIEKAAHLHADKIINNAEEEYQKIREKSMQLIQQFNQYKLQLKEAASAQLQLVEGSEFDIHTGRSGYIESGRRRNRFNTGKAGRDCKRQPGGYDSRKYSGRRKGQ